MSLKPSLIEVVPSETMRVARAAFPKGNLYISIRDELGTLFDDADFTTLYPRRGQPAFAPWRLALITVMQFLENLSDRQTAEAVRSRIDWKYALNSELTDSGFDYSVLSGFRERLITNEQPSLLFDRVIDLLRAKNLLKARGKQRTDSTHVLASIRVMNRLELVTETLRAALNELAVVSPVWLRSAVQPEWFARLRRENRRREYQNRAGIEGTLSQAVRRGCLRRSRYRGLQKTHLQEIAVATGINLLRTISFLNNKPVAKTRTSRFAKLAC